MLVLTRASRFRFGVRAGGFRVAMWEGVEPRSLGGAGF